MAKGMNQRNLKRERFLYVLVFKDENAIYIGQTVDLERRCREHERISDWDQPFEMFQLGSVIGNYFDGELHEVAWRIAFHRQEWRIYSLPPAQELKVEDHMATSSEIHRLVEQLQVPALLKRKKDSFMRSWKARISDAITGTQPKFVKIQGGQMKTPPAKRRFGVTESPSSAHKWVIANNASLTYAFILKSEVYDAYVAWCASNKFPALTNQMFWREMKGALHGFDQRTRKTKNEKGKWIQHYIVNITFG